ncbi:MAG: rubrerythrin family protein [Candidatus Moranbacteria bacterium]|nr:rubrerythrin family protein [Candidatus Moranbacteria bacterium]
MASREDLMAAFAGESQANRKYLAFAKKAEQEGYPAVAKLFRATAEAETVHAHAHLRAAEGIKDTVANLEAAISGEHYEFTDMYPGFIATAEAEGNAAALKSFSNANAVEKEHYALYEQALEAIKAGHDIEDLKIYVCPVCGHTEVGVAPDTCPICHVPKAQFIEIA